jgi:hypothetical protein
MPREVTLPPEMLPTPDGPAEVVVENSDGSRRVVYETDLPNPTKH